MERSIAISKFNLNRYLSGSTSTGKVFVGLLGVLAVYITIYITLFSSVAFFNSVQTDAAPPAWYNASWQYRKRITIPAANVTGTFAEFPVAIEIASDASLQAHALSNADDIIFVDHIGPATPVDHYIVDYDTATGALTAWVKFPNLSDASDNEVFMYYGNAGATNTEDPVGVWDHYDGVWSLEEAATDEGTTTTFNDLTTDNSPGQQAGSETAAGIIGNGQQFDGTNDYISIPNTTELQVDSEEITFTAWVKRDSTAPTEVLVSKGNDNTTAGWEYFEMRLRDDDFGVRETGINNLYIPATGQVTTTDWYLLAFTVDTGGGNTQINYYVNGPAVSGVGSTGTGYTSTDDDDLFLGFSSLNNNEFFSGVMDEVRFKRGYLGGGYTQAQNWLSTEYANLTDPAGFMSLSIEEEQGDLNSVVVSSLGASGPDLYIPSSGNLVSEVMVVQDTYSSKEIQEIIITDANSHTGIYQNLRLYYDYDTSAPYDCASESYSGSENQFGGNAVINGSEYTFTGSANISTVQTACFYMVLDVDGSAADMTVSDLGIADFANDITLSRGSVDSVTSVSSIWDVTLSTPPNGIVVSALGAESDLYNGDLQYVGGKFVFSAPVNSGSITGITITETGAVDATTGLGAARLYYEYDTSSPYNCVSETFNGTERKFGVTDTAFSAANGNVSFTGSTTVNPTSRCVPTWC